MTINHNAKIEIERVNGVFVAQVEIAGVGKCSRTRTTYATMEACLAGVAGHYADGYAALEAYGRPAPLLDIPTITEKTAPFAGAMFPSPVAIASSEAKIDRRTKEGKRRFAALATA